MQHHVTTNCAITGSYNDRTKLSTTLDAVAVAHGIAPINRGGLALIRKGADGDFFHVVVTGNGAILRDVVTALDQAGFLN